MIQFPTSLDTFQNPTAATTMDAAGFEHDVQHANANDALTALQAKLGVNGSADTASVDYLLTKILGVLFNVSGNSSIRFKDGQFQVWDTAYAAADAARPWAALTSVNGAPAFSGPIAN